MIPIILSLHLLLHGVLSHESSCRKESFQPPNVPGASVVEILVEERRNVTTPYFGELLPSVSGLDFCDIQVYLTHPGANDKVLVQTWLPLANDDWNGRYQAIGGGGFATGLFDFWFGPAIKAGFATSSTDGGHAKMDFAGAAWMINPDKSTNWPLVHNFAIRSLVDQIHIGKSITEQFYGQKPHHSYWNGCSQGGRQGYAIAQRYPELLDGILATAPAIKFPSLAMGAMWPAMAMNNASIPVSNCEMDWFRLNALHECDILDGVRDGVISDPSACIFNPKTIVGQKVHCSGHELTITTAIAETVQKMHQGPRTPFGSNIWPGFEYGTDLNPLFNVTIDPDGIRTLQTSAMFGIWVREVLVADPSFNASSLSIADWLSLWTETSEKYGSILDADDPDISAFRDAGGKLLTWHGINDATIPYQTTVDYHERVRFIVGGGGSVNDFYRLFLAPGVEHCGLGRGAWPRNPLDALVDWVEKGEPPETLAAETKDHEGNLVTRELCLWPRKPKYMGSGNANRASSWTCEGDDDEEGEEIQKEKRGDFLGGLRDRLAHVGLGMGLKVE